MSKAEFELIRKAEYGTFRFLLTHQEDFYFVIAIYDEDDEAPEYQDIVGFNQLIDAAIYFGRLTGQYCSSENM